MRIHITYLSSIILCYLHDPGKLYSELNVGIPKEIFDAEKRVALSPAGVKLLSKIGYGVNIESGAGNSAAFVDSMYEEAGAKITDKAGALGSDIVFKVSEY